MSRLEHLKLWVAAVLIRLIVQALAATWRVRIVAGAAHLDRLTAGVDPVVISFWHDRVFVFAHLIRTRLMRRGFGITVFSSHSRDGELGTKLARMWGAHVVRGSASRGGTEGLRAMYRSMVRLKSSPIVIPDGPQGPQYRAKPGGIVLAQMCRTTIVPMSFHTERAWHLGSWDRMIIPRPFALVRVAVGEPLSVARELTPEGLEAEQQRLAATLDGLLDRAKAA